MKVNTKCLCIIIQFLWFSEPFLRRVLSTVTSRKRTTHMKQSRERTSEWRRRENVRRGSFWVNWASHHSEETTERRETTDGHRDGTWTWRGRLPGQKYETRVLNIAHKQMNVYISDLKSEFGASVVSTAFVTRHVARPRFTLIYCMVVFTLEVFSVLKHWNTRRTSDLPHLNPAWTHPCRTQTIQTPAWTETKETGHRDVIHTNLNFCCQLWNNSFYVYGFHWKVCVMFPYSN